MQSLRTIFTELLTPTPALELTSLEMLEPIISSPHAEVSHRKASAPARYIHEVALAPA